MTPSPEQRFTDIESRARKIVDELLWREGPSNRRTPEQIKFVAAELRAVREEALEHEKILLNKVGMDEAEQYGYHKGLLRAAEIAFNYSPTVARSDGYFIAERIRKEAGK